MEPLTLQITAALVGLVFSVIAGILIHRANKHAEKIEFMSTAITKLQATSVSDSHVRTLIKEELQPIAGQLTSILSTMHKIEVHIAEEKGFKTAQGLVTRVRGSDS